jgi:uncharacterized protein YbjT (DUF2867 family)
MRTAKTIAKYLLSALLILLAAVNTWGGLTQGHFKPAREPELDLNANRVVMVFGATGSVGDGLLKAAIDDPNVKKIYVVTRHSSDRIALGVASGKVEEILQEDFTNYDNLAGILPKVNTVLWGLGTSSLQVDDQMYSRIHVDFPIAFVTAWRAARSAGPMSFHYVTGMGTDPNGKAHWAREKGRAEIELAALAAGSELRTFSYRVAYIRPTSEHATTLDYIAEALLHPGSLAISARDLGTAMLEISARTHELSNGTLIDTADSIAYADAYQLRQNG